MADDLAEKVDFQKRRDAAIKEMDAVLEKHKIGLILVLNPGTIPGVISELKPAIRYFDKKEQEAPAANGKAKSKKAKK